MAWLWGFLILIFFVVSMAGSFWFGYVAVERMVGREAARRNLRYTIRMFLFVFPLFFVISLLGIYGWVIFYILFAAGISSSLISWFFRKQEAGSLLADIGRNSQKKFIFWIGLLWVALAVFQTWSFFRLVSNGVLKYSLELEILELVCWWAVASYFIAVGLSKLEFRENGTCFMYSFIKYQRISSYTWEPTKPNVLTIRFKPLFPLLQPGFMSIAIPAKHKDVVDRILDERLPGKNL